jgi:hypothetical protein
MEARGNIPQLINRTRKLQGRWRAIVLALKEPLE